jgi:hypothetical protein
MWKMRLMQRGAIKVFDWRSDQAWKIVVVSRDEKESGLQRDGQMNWKPD